MTKKQSEKTGIQIWEQPEFKGSSLIPTPESVLSLTNPQALVGRENVDVDDLIVPTLQLLQGQSDAVTSGVPDAKPGIFQHSNTGRLFVPPLKCVVVHYHKSNAFFPQTDKYPEAKGKDACLSRDSVSGTVYGDCEECGFCLNWFEDGRPPMGAKNHVFSVLTPDGPAVLRFSRSSHKAGKKFLTNWNFSSKNLWHHPVVIRVTSEQKELDSGKKSTYYKMDIQWQTEETTPPDWQKACLEMYQRISGAHEAGKFGDELEGQAEVGEFD
jgi:hypothetical protein